MPDTFTYVLSFIVAIGILVTAHEFGHFWVARRVGVKVLRFSVGFGRPLLTHTAADGTEYTLAALPLGGYVKMLDEREGPVDAAEAHRAFNRQSLGKRAAVVVAGPLANFLFAIVAYWLMLMIGVTGSVPLLGDITPGSAAAQAGLQAGERIVSVGGKEVQTWSDALLAMVDDGIADHRLQLTVVDPQGSETTHAVEIGAGVDPTATDGLLGQLGIEQAQPHVAPRVDSVEAGSPAEIAGVHAGDLIVRAGDQAIADWVDLVRYVRARPAQHFDLSVQRAGDTLVLPITAASHEADGKTIGQIGVKPQIDDAYLESFRTEVRYGPVDAFGRALGKTWDGTVLLLRVLGKLVVGEASLRNVSGPLSIAEYAGVSASLGVAYFLAFLAIVSISLGVLNLLPVPVLDGGHLLYYLMELVRGGRPLSERAQLIGQQIGIGLLLMLMLLAFYNDLTRLLGPA